MEKKIGKNFFAILITILRTLHIFHEICIIFFCIIFCDAWRGIFAIFITSVLSYPLNKLLYKFTDIKNIIGINFNVMLVIFGLSIFVAILGGLLPARIAMNKDPIECLKTE